MSFRAWACHRARPGSGRRRRRRALLQWVTCVLCSLTFCSQIVTGMGGFFPIMASGRLLLIAQGQWCWYLCPRTPPGLQILGAGPLLHSSTIDRVLERLGHFLSLRACAFSPASSGMGWELPQEKAWCMADFVGSPLHKTGSLGVTE